MKKLSKTIFSIAAVAAVSAVMAASAMAADTDVEATYDASTGTVTLSSVEATGASQTLLILNDDDTPITSDNANDIIVQINQKDDGTSFETVKVGELENGTYYVRIGGDGNIQIGTFTVGDQGGDDPVVPTKDIIVGDIDGDGNVKSNDANYVLIYANHSTKYFGEAGTVYDKADNSGQVTVGDINGDSTVNVGDAGYILRYANTETTRIGNAGTTITVINPTE